MGTALLANSTIKLSFAWNAFFFWGVWAVCIIGLGDRALGRAAVQALGPLDHPGHPHRRRRSASCSRSTTTSSATSSSSRLIDVIPGADLLQVHDLPYMFLLMVGVALVRKPGCVTAMVFINYLLAQLLFGSGHGALDWTDGLTQGIFCDLYIVARRGKVYAPGASVLSMVVDGLMIGLLRGGPNAFLTDWTFDPYLNSTYYTWYADVDRTPGRTPSATASRRRSARCSRCAWPRRWCRRSAPGSKGRDADVDPFAEPQPRRALRRYLGQLSSGRG